VSDLTPEDVQEILRLVDDAGVEELDLETPRFTIRYRRGGERAVEEPRAPVSTDGLVEVTAPTVGRFYRAPAPEEAPFVEVGTAVEPDTQVCILEVMKLMSPVVAGVRGRIAEVCRDDGEPVQFGDVLFRVET
jgi:biotin carboxyl carrier protein